MRIRLLPKDTKIDFFRRGRITFVVSIVLVLLSLGVFFVKGLNFGIDFRGGTTIRTNSETPVDLAAYRSALRQLNLGDVTISEVFDPAKPDQNVTQIRIGVKQGEEAISPDALEEIRSALWVIAPSLRFDAVESVGPKVSGELIKTAVLAVLSAIGVVLIYIWMRFEWQFSLGAVAALLHDLVLTIGVFSIFQIKFDLAIIAALLTIVGYSLNDTVVVFDRVRENLRKYKKKDLTDVLNLSINETLSRTIMTSVTTLLALISLFLLGGDVIRGFVFAMIWGVIVGTYSSIYVASNVLLLIGVKRDWTKSDDGRAGTKFAGVDA